MTVKEWIEYVEKHAVDLAEHCDSVRIFVTRSEHDGNEETTQDFNCGRGNFVAQVGQIQEWMWRQEGRNKQFQIKQDERHDEGEQDEESNP